MREAAISTRRTRNASIPIDLEEAYLLASITTTPVPTHSRGNDYYESAVVNPDIVLRDLVKIFHPELVQEECVYYKQLK